MISVLAAAAATQPDPLIVQDIPLIALGILVPLVLCAVLVFARRMFASQAIKDFLGITATFVVLSAFGWLMIVGEHVLG